MRILLCSIAFPPKSDPECLQTGKYFYFLSKIKDLKIDVLTSSIPTLFMQKDDSLIKYDNGWDEKVEINIPENKYINYILRKLLPYGVDFPDSKFLFYWQWRKTVKKIKNKPDIIYSRSYPLSSTIMAYKLKKYYNVPWILHLSDPWLLSPIHYYNKWQLKWHQKWEKRCFESANKICLTSLNTIDLYVDQYPEFKNKFEYFPNVYDPEDIKDNPLSFDNKLRFVYTGGLTNKRSVSWFIPIFEKLSNNYPGIEDKIEFIFAGSMDTANRKLFEKYQFSFVKHVGILNYKQALALQNSSHILINIDNPVNDSKKAVFFPSKLLDYFLSKRRILSLSTLGSTTHQVLKYYSSDVCDNHSQTTITKFIEKALYEWQSKNQDYFFVDRLPVQYSAKKNAERLAILIKAAHEKSSE